MLSLSISDTSLSESTEVRAIGEGSISIKIRGEVWWRPLFAVHRVFLSPATLVLL